MKIILLILFFSLPFASFSESHALTKDQKLALKVANLLLRPEVSKCIQDAGFNGTKLLTQAASVKLTESIESSIFEIKIEHYEILPTDGTRLASTTNLILESKVKRTRAGNDQAISCQFVETKKP